MDAILTKSSFVNSTCLHCQGRNLLTLLQKITAVERRELSDDQFTLIFTLLSTGTFNMWEEKIMLHQQESSNAGDRKGRVDRVIEGASVHTLGTICHSTLCTSRRRENMFQRRAAGCCVISLTWRDTDVSEVGTGDAGAQKTREALENCYFPCFENLIFSRLALICRHGFLLRGKLILLVPTP
jgi:hypothetical protein